MSAAKITLDQTAAKDKPPAAQRAGDKILETASALFYQQGIRAVGVDEIVSRAGVTKPSLYRNFLSKDELAASYLRAYDERFWQRFDAAIVAHPGDPRAQLLQFVGDLAIRATSAEFRGCGLTNAAVEYPEPDHPARLVSEDSKRRVNARLKALAEEVGADDPELLADGLQLLIEGVYASAQLFDGGGPARSIARTAEILIDASLARRGNS